jgi:hypothetical protein
MLMAKHDVILLIHSLACKHSTGHMIILEAAFHVTLQRGATLSTEAAECALAGTAEGSIKSHELAAIILIDLGTPQQAAVVRPEELLRALLLPLASEAMPDRPVEGPQHGAEALYDPIHCESGPHSGGLGADHLHKRRHR